LEALSTSSSADKFAHMFDELVAAAKGMSGAEAVGAWAKVEAAACARRLAAMVDVFDRRYAAGGSEEREQWCLDNWHPVSAELGAAQQLTSGGASSQLLIATALRDRLPRVAALFADGTVSYRVVTAMVWRTALIKDPDAIRAVDEALVSAVGEWKPMSAAKIEAAIDFWVDHFDGDALRRTQSQARSRGVEIASEDASGLASVWGTLFAHDAAALDRRLDAMARAVCDGDERTLDQRRADALGALANGADRLACRCGADECAAAAPATGVVIHVVAGADDIGLDDRTLDGAEPRRLPNKRIGQMTLAEALSPQPTGRAPARPGVMMGGPVLSAAMVGRLACQARIEKVVHPGDAVPEPRYVPSQALADFIRCRDLTCRFPGCDHPANRSDVDHTIPYPIGPTQASNLKCLCRKHRLLKIFWGGSDGWGDRQQVDGTVIWTAPSGQTYTTRPGSWLLFPALCLPTASVSTRNAVRSDGSPRIDFR
jgi:hypothetical protein